jgi:predicted phosphodiesterase
MNDVMENPDIGRRNLSRKYGVSEKKIRPILKRCKLILQEQREEIDDPDERLVVYLAKLEKQKQRLMDQQRIERKIRNQIRVDNSLADYGAEILKIFKEREVNYTLPVHQANDDVVGIFQISDTHFNELINITGNQYDFKIAARRLQKYVNVAKKQFKTHNIQKVVVAMTGDLLNSDRRLDELLNMATNRAKATSLSAILLEQVIVDLAQDFEVTLTYVTGNESRAGEYMGTTEIMISDNYDVTIFEMLKLMFRDTNVNFIEGSVGEKVVQIKNKNVLLIHGHQMKGSISKQSQQIKGKYSDLNIKIDYILFGHIHECLIADFYARSSSLCGANAYSNNLLQLTSRASQNIHFVSNTSINSMKIDLQEYEEYEGYDIDASLEAYNAKSSEKGKDNTFIVVNIL